MKTRSVEFEGKCECGEGDETEDLEYCYGDDEEGGAKSELIHLFSEEEEVNKFMGMIEEELVKVEEFYMMKEVEMMEKWEALNKQLKLLLTLKRVFSDEQHRDLFMSSSNSVSLRSSSLSSSGG